MSLPISVLVLFLSAMSLGGSLAGVRAVHRAVVARAWQSAAILIAVSCVFAAGAVPIARYVCTAGWALTAVDAGFVITGAVLGFISLVILGDCYAEEA